MVGSDCSSAQLLSYQLTQFNKPQQLIHGTVNTNSLRSVQSALCVCSHEILLSPLVLPVFTDSPPQR
ncbi:hypothetical protein J6590_099584 [Homalodisca vitripennis]|nr:hypothetical protein J6590_099584 [Homalodisca vitripennis]